MTARRCRNAVVLVLLCAVSSLAGEGAPGEREAATLEETLARYARYGAEAWARNPAARIAGEGTACVSCHTSLPYALVEPLLPGAGPAYDDLVLSVTRRVTTWSENTPWYADAKLEQTAALSGIAPEILKELLDAEDSRGVEAVLNTFVLAMRDAYAGAPASKETREAFENLWSAQIVAGPAAGRWRWIRASLVPWEVGDSDVWGASLACVAASRFPGLAPPASEGRLHASLRKAAGSPDVSAHAKAAVLWCDAETGRRVLAESAAEALAADLRRRQRPSGGWALRDLGPWPDWEGSAADCCGKREIRADAYATGLVTLALLRHGASREEAAGRAVEGAVAWIERRLADPYPAEPRHNRHESAEAELPELRNQLYANAGHMWAYLARRVALDGRAPWAPR